MPQGRPRRNSYRPPRRLRPSRSRAATAKSARPFSGPRLGGSSSRPCAARGRGRFLPASACNRVRPACANRKLGTSPPCLPASSRFRRRSGPVGRRFLRGGRLRPSRSRAAAVGSARPFSGPRLGGSSARPCAARERGRFLPASACNRVRPACANRKLGTSPPCLPASSRFRRRSGPVGRRFPRGGRPRRNSYRPLPPAAPFAVPGRSCQVRPSFLGASPRRKLRPAVRRKDGLAETFIAPPRRLTLRDPGPQLSGTPVPSRCLASEEAPPGRAPQGDAAVSFRHPLATAFGRPVRIGGSALRLPASSHFRRRSGPVGRPPRGKRRRTAFVPRGSVLPPPVSNREHIRPDGRKLRTPAFAPMSRRFPAGHGLRSGGCNDCVAVTSPRLVRLRRHSQSVASLSSAVRIIRFTKGL